MNKMRDDQDFNIHFVKIIEKERCLYDKTLPEYRSKDEHDRIWQKISTEVNESVAHCKERWRNLRACLTRHLKQQQYASDGTVFHKPYYLADHMKFLFPFTKSRPNKEASVFETTIEFENSPQRSIKQEKQSNLSTQLDSGKTTVEPTATTTETTTTTLVSTVSETEIDGNQFVTFVHNANGELTEALDVTGHTQTHHHHQQLHLDESSITDPKTIEATYHTTNTTTIQEAYEPNIKRMKIRCPDTDDADLNFFKSLLPDIRMMTASQKRRFKMGIFGLIDKVLTNSECIT